MGVDSVLVVGGGVAGLTAAAALGRAGVRCEVVDLRDGAEGSGLGIQNRGIDALDAIGALDEVVAIGATYQQAPLRFYDAAGELVSDPGVPLRPDGKPSYLIIYRPRLAEILRGCAERAGAAVRIGVSVSRIEDGPDGVAVTFTDGTTGTYDLVVGADGLRSTVRRMVFGDAVTPLSTGTVSLRWLPTGAPRGEAGFYYGGDAEMVVVPMHDDMTYVSVQHPDDAQLTEGEGRELLRKKFAQFTSPYLTALAERLTDDQPVLVRRYEWLMVDGPWHRGRVVLIGDAAHATTAHLGSGGVMALEDAVVLAEVVRAGGPVEDLLHRFHARRHERCRTVVDTSVRLSDMQRAGAPADEMGAARWPALHLLSQPF
ncbi:FAD-dependent monooxygenase [Pseudonocardia pini]|uniref:FAD-dependent monooxygenase n=1 Tax=Pseudonocardia pini TaxID=2758030 RepID=UPI0015F0970C|nr:FAD-dependent monooxygenase [Pseudonocardia pini]